MLNASQSLVILLKTMCIKPYPTFDRIIKSFWFLVKLEFYLEINIADPDHPLQPAATYASVSHIWDYVWSNMKQVRGAHRWVCPDPRLRELDVVAGSFRQGRQKRPHLWEHSQQQRFRATAREGKECRGLAHVTCLEVEDLKKGIGRYIRNGDLENAVRRATYGPSNDPEPDYWSLTWKIAASSPSPGD